MEKLARWARRAIWCAYVEAGFSKVHLDRSMPCADDHELTEAAIAERAAQLYAVAEEATAGGDLVYVIGTQVPIPGGELETIGPPPDAARRTFELHRAAFAARGIVGAIDKIIALVVQPGSTWTTRRCSPTTRRERRR